MPKKPKPEKKTHRRAPAAKAAPALPMYLLRLYITGQTPRSETSVRNLRKVCDEYLTGRFELEIIDIYQQPELAQEAQIIAAPTLIKQLPLPLRRLVGNLSDTQRVVLGLDLKAEAV
jgi:circadian clock protein KaiB